MNRMLCQGINALQRWGIDPETSRDMSDVELLKMAFIGPKVLRALREQYGQWPDGKRPKPEILSDPRCWKRFQRAIATLIGEKPPREYLLGFDSGRMSVIVRAWIKLNPRLDAEHQVGITKAYALVVRSQERKKFREFLCKREQLPAG